MALRLAWPTFLVDDVTGRIGFRNLIAGLDSLLADPLASPTVKWAAGQYVVESSIDNVTAFAGGGQGSATVTSGQTIRITTVNTLGDSVKLPPSIAGLELLVINHGLNAAQIFGTGSDQIDDIASSIGVNQMANSLVIYSCATAGNWYSEGLATGFGGPGLQTSSFTNNITALAGGAQVGATLLTTMLNRLVTVVTIGDSIRMMTAVPGLVIQIANSSANSANLFPAVGDQINSLGVNVAFAVAGGKNVTLFCVAPNLWHAILSA